MKIIKTLLTTKQIRYFLAIIFLAIIDLTSKRITFAILDKKAVELGAANYFIKVTDFFNIVQVWNRGVSFGMFNNITYAQFILSFITIIIIVILIYWLNKAKDNLTCLALVFIIGGAFGNLVDRVKYGAVADFLDFHLFGYHWPAFNLADSFIFIGVCLLLLEEFLIFKKNVKKPNKIS